MKAIGFRADPRTIYWAVVEQSGVDLLQLEASSKLPAPAAFEESEALSWFRKEVRSLIDQYKPNRIGVKFPETNARIGNVSSTFARVRIEGVILEAAHSKDVPVVAGALVTMTSRLGTDSAKAYLKATDFRGIDLTGIAVSDYRREAILVAGAAMGGEHVRG